MDRLTAKATPEGTLNYTYDAAGHVESIASSNTNGASMSYTYGLQRISEEQEISSAWTPSFYGYDAMGSVRQLTNASGTVTDSYEYDAYGNSFTISGSTLNNYLYRGEQYDSDLGLYYLRARYYNPGTGRFMSRDPEDGKPLDPKTLHKYLYAGGDPVNMYDPSGRDIAGYAKTTLIVGGSALSSAELFLGGTADQLTEWAIATETGIEEIGGYLVEVAGEEAVGAYSAAYNSLTSAINEFNAIVNESSVWGGSTRLLLCTDVGLAAAEILEYYESPKWVSKLAEVGSTVGCGYKLEYPHWVGEGH